MERTGPAERKILRDAFVEFSPEAIVSLHDRLADEIDRCAARAASLRESGIGDAATTLGAQAQFEARAYQEELVARRLGAFFSEITGIEMPRLLKPRNYE